MQTRPSTRLDTERSIASSSSSSFAPSSLSGRSSRATSGRKERAARGSSKNHGDGNEVTEEVRSEIERFSDGQPKAKRRKLDLEGGDEGDDGDHKYDGDNQQDEESSDFASTEEVDTTEEQEGRWEETIKDDSERVLNHEFENERYAEGDPNDDEDEDEQGTSDVWSLIKIKEEDEQKLSGLWSLIKPEESSTEAEAELENNAHPRTSSSPSSSSSASPSLIPSSNSHPHISNPYYSPTPTLPASSPSLSPPLPSASPLPVSSPSKHYLTLSDLPKEILLRIISFLPPPVNPPHHLPTHTSKPHPKTLTTLHSLCLVGKKSLLQAATTALFKSPYIPSRNVAHRLHVSFHSNPSLRALVKRLEIDLEGMCDRNSSGEHSSAQRRASFYGSNGGIIRKDEANAWLPWYLHQTLLFLSPILLGVHSLLEISIFLPQSSSVYMYELCRLFSNFDKLRHFSKDLFAPASHIILGRDPEDPDAPQTSSSSSSNHHLSLLTFPPQEIAVKHSYMMPPPFSPSLWPVKMFLELIKKSWNNLEYFAFRGLVSDFASSGGGGGGNGGNGGVWSLPRKVGNGGGGKYLKEVVLVDVAIVDDDLAQMIESLTIQRIVLWRSSLVTRNGLRDAILRYQHNSNNNSTSNNKLMFQPRKNLKILVIGTGWWATSLSKLQSSTSDSPDPCQFPLDEMLLYLPDLKHLHFEGDLLSSGPEGFGASGTKWTCNLETMIIRGGGASASKAEPTFTPTAVKEAFKKWGSRAKVEGEETETIEKKPPIERMKIVFGGGTLFREVNPDEWERPDELEEVIKLAKEKGCQFEVPSAQAEIVDWV